MGTKQVKRISLTFTILVFSYLVVNIELYSQELIRTVKIGDKYWTNQNLFKTKFNNGDDIIEAKSPYEWWSACKNKKPAYFANETKKGEYGIMYNSYAINDFRGLVPEGYRLPTCEDWIALSRINSDSSALLLSTSDGYFKGNNQFKFNAIPTGYRLGSNDWCLLWGEQFITVWWAENTECTAAIYAESNILDPKYRVDNCMGAYVRCIRE